MLYISSFLSGILVIGMMVVVMSGSFNVAPGKAIIIGFILLAVIPVTVVVLLELIVG